MLNLRKPILLLLAVVISYSAFSQSSIKGAVQDTIDKKSLVNTVVTLMRKPDSVLVKFARADKDGKFEINGLAAGEYILMATHPYLGDVFENIDVKANEVKQLGNINMIPKSKLLAEVIIRSGSPIRIKGDTTVYTADSFKVRPGANVEELLRRLPGIQVDKNGQITAMGERVKKVLVDGEEFFGSDPGIATKNLRADAVKEVEVFDKKSDQAEFTGIDDGVRDKTINLKMKQKRGYFGKIEAGGGLKDKYDNSAMINAFKDKRKIAAYGIMSNTGQTNLDWQDAQNYGGGSDNMETGISDDGGMYIMMSSNGDDNYYGGRNGIPQNWNAGVHYSNKYDNNRQSLNFGYKFSKVNAPGVTSTFTKNFFPDTSWNTQSRNDRFSSTNKHNVNLTLDLTIDSMNSIKWTTKANRNTSSVLNDYTSAATTDAGLLINENNRRSNTISENDNINTALLWKKKFKKLARTLSVNADFNWTRSDNDGLLYSRINYYDQGMFLRFDSIDQQQLRNSEGKSINVKAAYTEPLMKDFYMELSYALNLNNNDNDRNIFEKDGTGKYQDVIDSLSNSFTFNRFVHTPGLSFRINKKKVNASFGASVGFSHFEQRNNTDGLQNEHNFTNFFPRASFTYKFKPSESARFNYNGSTTPPSLEQLQPIRVNTDPLNIYIGNPNLDQSFRHSFNAGYNSYNVLKERNIWVNVNYSFTQNAFTQFSTIDSGVRTFQTVNVDGISNLNFFGDYGFKIKDTKWRLNFGPTVNWNKNIDFVADNTGLPVKNTTTTSSYGMRLSVSQWVQDKFNFHIGPNFTWNSSKASVNTAANAEYWQINGWASGSVTFKKGIEINTNLDFQARQKDPRFPADNNFTTWNAFIIKRFFKENALEAKFGVYDILNQNRGYNRNFNSFSFTETYYNTLKRFWLLTLTWNISKNGKPASGW